MAPVGFVDWKEEEPVTEKRCLPHGVLIASSHGRVKLRESNRDLVHRPDRGLSGMRRVLASPQFVRSPLHGHLPNPGEIQAIRPKG